MTAPRRENTAAAAATDCPGHVQILIRKNDSISARQRRTHPAAIPPENGDLNARETPSGKLISVPSRQNTAKDSAAASITAAPARA